jgi:hypothetical protein
MRVHKSASCSNPTQHLCLNCDAYFNVFSGTVFQGTHWPSSKVVLVLRGFSKGDSTLSMSRELKLGYSNLLYLRHELMGIAADKRPMERLADKATESDEMYQNSGEKSILHPDPEDPPRRRANKKRTRKLVERPSGHLRDCWQRESADQAGGAE